MILTDPYKARTLKLINTKGINSEVLKYITIDYPYILENQKVNISPFQDTNGWTDYKTVVLYGFSHTENEIIPVDHPFFLEGEGVGILDLRKYVNVGEDYQVTIRNDAEYNLALVRYILSGLWKTGCYSQVYSLELAHAAFASWLSDNLTHKFGLSLGDNVKLRVLASIYYRRLFTDKVEEDELEKLQIRTKKDLIVPDLLKEIHPIVEKMSTIDDFCEACFEVTQNVRLKGLDYTVLANILSNNWLGALGRELTLLSLEHPPTWVSLVYMALTQRVYKRTFVTSTIDKLGKRGRDQEFVKQIESIVKNKMREKY